VAYYVGDTDKCIWRVVKHYVLKAMGKLDLSGLRGIGLDETATKRGHHYVTIFVDMDRETRPEIFAMPCKGKDYIKTFAEFLKKREGKTDNVLEVVCDVPRLSGCGGGDLQQCRRDCGLIPCGPDLHQGFGRGETVGSQRH